MGSTQSTTTSKNKEENKEIVIENKKEIVIEPEIIPLEHKRNLDEIFNSKQEATIFKYEEKIATNHTFKPLTSFNNDYISCSPTSTYIGTISQVGFVVTGNASFPFTSTMKGGIITYASGSPVVIIKIISTTLCVVNKSQTVASTTATIEYEGFQTDSTGAITSVGYPTPEPITVQSSTKVSYGFKTSPFTVTLPTNYEGNLIMIIVLGGNYGTCTLAINQGYTACPNPSTTTSVINVFWKIAGSSEVNPTITPSASDTFLSDTLIISGVHPINPVHSGAITPNTWQTGNPLTFVVNNAGDNFVPGCTLFQIWNAYNQFSTLQDFVISSSDTYTLVDTNTMTGRCRIWSTNCVGGTFGQSTFVGTVTTGQQSVAFTGIQLILYPARQPAELINYGKLTNEGPIKAPSINSSGDLKIGDESSSVTIGNPNATTTVAGSLVSSKPVTLSGLNNITPFGLTTNGANVNCYTQRIQPSGGAHLTYSGTWVQDTWQGYDAPVTIYNSSLINGNYVNWNVGGGVTIPKGSYDLDWSQTTSPSSYGTSIVQISFGGGSYNTYDSMNYITSGITQGSYPRKINVYNATDQTISIRFQVNDATNRALGLNGALNLKRYF